MEADWSVEIGGDAMVIEAHWPGFIDLRQTPKKIAELEEVLRFPPLGWALQGLNVLGGPLWTSKCDVWTLIAVNMDPDEMGAKPDDLQAGRACYLDVLLRERISFSSFERQERWVRGLTQQLRAIELPRVRVELVVRRAVTNIQVGYGITVYCAACGPTDKEAEVSLEQALRAVVPLLSRGMTR
jgi:hypothetical protein